MYWYFQVLKKYFDLTGRARRAEYWYFVLFNIIFTGIFEAIDIATGSFNPEYGMGLMTVLYTLAIMLPGIAVTIRRLHDTSRNGMWFLVALLPVVGAIVLIVFMVQDSTPGANQFGPNPKGVTA